MSRRVWGHARSEATSVGEEESIAAGDVFCPVNCSDVKVCRSSVPAGPMMGMHEELSDAVLTGACKSPSPLDLGEP